MTYSFVSHNGLIINDHFIDFLKSIGLADLHNLAHFQGGHLLKKNRYRSIVKIDQDGKTLYLKKHFWPVNERVKSIVPWAKKEDAHNEWQNMQLLNELGFSTMIPVAFGEIKKLGMPFLSVTLTEHIYRSEKLETYLPKNFHPPLGIDDVLEKRSLIRNVATVARDFHNKGLNHQDFYLGHIFIRPVDKTLFIIDLQRIHHRASIRRRDMIKDLAQIAYSALGLNIFTRTDLMRFFHTYLNRDTLKEEDKKLIKNIQAKVRKIARHDAKLQLRKIEKPMIT